MFLVWIFNLMTIHIYHLRLIVKFQISNIQIPNKIQAPKSKQIGSLMIVICNLFVFWYLQFVISGLLMLTLYSPSASFFISTKIGFHPSPPLEDSW
jgi:hypothetical protein